MTLTSQEIDDLPFIEALHKTAEMKWSGILRVVKDAEQIGSVFMREGQVGWAVSNNQTENFGSFLQRIGMVSKEKLEETVNRYRALGKSKKLGSLLVEEGLITNTKLRECLRAHIRAAVSSMMDDQEVVIKASHGEMLVEANLIFNLNEVLPSYYQPDEAEEDSQPATTNDPATANYSAELQEILGQLTTLPGYQFSFVFESRGELKTLHKSEQCLNDEDMVHAAIDWVDNAAKHVANGCFGRTETLILEHENGKLIAQFINQHNREHFVAVAFNRDGKLGVIKHKIAELVPAILNLSAQGI